jgi:hypothetical protein
MTDPDAQPTDEGDAEDTIALTLEIDPAEFDEPRQLMWENLVEEYGQATVSQLIAANLGQDLTARTMQLVNALWDNRHQLAVTDEQAVDPEALTDDTEAPDE